MASSYNELFGKGTHSIDADLIGWWECQDDGASDVWLSTSAGANVADGSLQLDNSNFGALTSNDSPVPYLQRSIEWQSGREATRNRAEFETSGATTWLLWYNATSYSANNDGIVSRDGTSNFTNSVEINSSGQPRQYIRDSAGSSSYSTGTLSGSATGQWYHVGAVYDPSVKNEIFVDGVSGGAAVPGGSQNAQVIEVGRGTQRIRNFNGKTSNVAFFHRELTSAEIDEHRLGPEPINVSAPVISGLPSDTEVIYLTSPGVWDTQDNGVITYTYQWQRDGVDISGETGTTYTWTLANDAGTDITCVVTASNDGGSDSAEVTSSNAVQDKSYNKLFGKGNKSADADLFGYWEMQETSGTTLTDSSGNSNDMSCDFTVSSANGPSTWLPSAVDFGATTDTRIAQLSGSFGTNARTMMLWEYPSGFTASYDGDSFGLTNGGSDWQRMQRQGANVSVRCVAGANSITSGVKAQDQWDHHAFVTTSTTLSSYLNGSLDTTGTGALVGGQDRLAIGGLVRNGSADVAWWAGRLAGACMFDRELTPAEIDEHRTGPEPINLTAPSINVPTALTDTLTCTNGTWDSQNNGTVTLSFQWLRDGIPISGAVSSTYNMTTDDLGTQISCRVKASNNGGYDSLEITESNKVTTVKEQTKQVTAGPQDHVTYNSSTLLSTYDLDFNPGSGENMAIVVGTYNGRTGSSTTSVVYDPGGPDEASFTQITDSDTNRELALWVLLDADIVKGSQKTIRATSSQTTKWGITAASFTGCNQAMPVDLQVDSTVAGTSSSIDDTNTVDSGMSIVGCSPVSNRSINVGADQTLFDATTLWVNSMRAAVTYKVATGTTTTSSFSYSNTTDWTHNAIALAPAPYPVNTAAPAVTGTAAVGSTLTCSTGTWSNPGTGSLTYQYQWVRDKDFIPNANSSTYTLRPADKGYRISCVVVASNDSGHDPESWTQSDWVATSSSYNQLYGGGRHSHDPTLRAFYGCQEASGGSTIANNTGDLPDCTYVGTMNTVAGPTSWLPSAISFSDSAYAWAASTSEVVNRLTITAWSKSRDLGDGYSPGLGNVFWQSNGSTGTERALQDDPTRGTCYKFRANGGTGRYTPNMGHVSDTWRHLVAVDQANKNRYGFLDNVKSSSNTYNVDWFAGTNTVNRVNLGCSYKNSLLNGFTGDLAGVSFFGRALSDDEVGEVYSGPEPVNITEPTVTGTAVPGQVLTTDNGVWDNMNNGAVSYTYSWYYSLVGDETDEVQISGETGATFTIPSGYENVWVRSRVAATNDGGLDEAEITASEFVQVTPSRVYVRPLPIVPDNFEIDYSHPLNDGLIKWIPFWNRKGGGDFDDVVSGRVSTTPSASSTLRSADMVYAPQGGRVPLWEAGTDRYIEWLDSDTGALGVANLTDFTVAAWVKNDTTRTTNKYICIAGEGVLGDWGFYIAGADDPSIGWTTGTGSTYRITTWSNALAGYGDEWVHLAVAVYGVNEVGGLNSSRGTDSYIALYINGDLYQADAISSWGIARVGDTTGTFGVGNRKTDYARSFDNAISDLRVYNKAIPRQIKDLYEVSSRPGEYNRQGVIRSPLGGNRRLMPMGGEVTPPPPSTGYRIYENYYRQLLAGYRGF